MQTSPATRLDIPDSLRTQILEFRRRLWCIKLMEGVAGACIGVLAGYLATYALDRWMDTPRLVRWGMFSAAVFACTLIPLVVERWVWRHRRLDQLARLLTQSFPSVGDQLLGIIELSQNTAEQARSPVLVEAAIRQVAALAEQRDFRQAVPRPRHMQRGLTAALLAGLAVVLLLATAAAARNAWARFLAPWRDTPRYTFAAVEPLPDRWVVPHGEPVTLPVRLSAASEWRPPEARVEVNRQLTVGAKLVDGAYRFELPGQIAPATLSLAVGDYRGALRMEPMHRPELRSLSARIQLPDYLGRPEPIDRDIRGGTLTAVDGSVVSFTARLSRELTAARVNGQPRTPRRDAFTTPSVEVGQPQELHLEWTDVFGLQGQAPLRLSVVGAADEPPSVLCENLPRQRVVLDSEVLAFQVRARDDFGVKRVGLEWAGLDKGLPHVAQGEQIIAAGGPQAEFLELAATFSAQSLGIAPQPIALRVFVEDYLPGRERVYSPVCVLDVLNAEQHAIWVTAMLSRWHRMSLEVRDRELQLHEVNKALRELPPEELDQPEVRRRIEAQAAAERTNGRRLAALTASGEELLRQAMRNPELGVGHLERWAEMMQILKDIAGNRMPSVADLLKQGAQAPRLGQSTPGKTGPMAGQNRSSTPGQQSQTSSEQQPPPAPVPSITDVESTHHQPQPQTPRDPQESPPKQPRLTLPSTMLAGNGRNPSPPPPSAAQQVEEAVRQQQDLLAEFEKIVDELNEVLANLEGSTLVKRLKAASRRQQQVSARLAQLASDAFGVAERLKERQAETFRELADVETKSSLEVSHIMDDMSAYFDRSRLMRFKVVLDDMRAQDVTAALRTLGDDLRKENGLSIAQAEYWSETLDRWAEDLVEVCKSGQCPGCKSKGSLPPSIVLEVLQILEREVALREETRVAEQARSGVTAAEHQEAAEKLSQVQDSLRERIDKVILRIQELPDAETDFGRELALLDAVSEVMIEATEILATPDTGPPAIAAETEAIELLLQSRRFNPNGGGGGGPNPGGGGGGDTTDSALALVGSGLNEKEVREDRGTPQATGSAGVVLPEEFRAGLDEYFNRLDAPTP